MDTCILVSRVCVAVAWLDHTGAPYLAKAENFAQPLRLLGLASQALAVRPRLLLLGTADGPLLPGRACHLDRVLRPCPPAGTVHPKWDVAPGQSQPTHACLWDTQAS